MFAELRPHVRVRVPTVSSRILPRFLVAATALVVWLSAVCTYGLDERPNVVLIVADDIGYGDVGAYHEMLTGEAPVVPTPNLDALARAGMVFTDAHTAAAVCAPTRYSLMTGSYPHRNGRPNGTWGLQYNSGFERGGSHVTVGEVMQAAGYRTGFFGKMHFGGQPQDADGNETHDFTQIDFSKPVGGMPSAHGFDYSFGTNDGIHLAPFVYWENDRFQPIDPNKPADNSTIRLWNDGSYPGPNGTSVIVDYPPGNVTGVGDVDWDSSQTGILLSDKAVNFIDRHLAQNAAHGEDKPFMMFYASQAVHRPHTPPIDFEPGDPENVIPVAGETINAKTDMIYELDLQVGKIIQKLEDEGLVDNTLIVFTSDNGGLRSMADEQAAGHDSNEGLRGSKAQIYEGGHRVPLIAKWGDGTSAGSYIEPGSVSDQLVAAHDFVASMYDLTRQDMPEGEAMDSTTLLSVLFGQQDEDDPIRSLLLTQAVPWQIGGIRHGDWFLVVDPDTNATELYNLVDDPQQTTNLIDDPDQQERVAEMRTLFLLYNDRDAQNLSEPRSTARFFAADRTLLPHESPADFDVDGDVDGDDFLVWQSGFGVGAIRAEGDADRDGDVDGHDFLIWQSEFLAAGGGSMGRPEAVPETATSMLVVIVAALFACSGRVGRNG